MSVDLLIFKEFGSIGSIRVPLKYLSIDGDVISIFLLVYLISTFIMMIGEIHFIIWRT